MSVCLFFSLSSLHYCVVEHNRAAEEAKEKTGEQFDSLSARSFSTKVAQSYQLLVPETALVFYITYVEKNKTNTIHTHKPTNQWKILGILDWE